MAASEAHGTTSTTWNGIPRNSLVALRRNDLRMFYPVLYHRKPAASWSDTDQWAGGLLTHNPTFQSKTWKTLLPSLSFWIKTCFVPLHCSFKNSPPLKYSIDKAMFDQIIGKQVICKVAVKTLA